MRTKVFKVLMFFVIGLLFTNALVYAQHGFFAINDDNFIDRSIPVGKPSSAGLQASGGKVLVEVDSKKGWTVQVIEGTSTLWGHGSKHTWIGKDNDIYGYIFSSDNNNPLEFRVDKDKGYVYLKGKGSVTVPKGAVVTHQGKVAVKTIDGIGITLSGAGKLPEGGVTIFLPLSSGSVVSVKEPE